MFKKVFHILSLTLLLSLGCFVAVAQNRTVTGKVVDQAGEALMGVAVIQQGTSNGTVTDLDGSFALQVSGGDVTLEITSLGYVSKTMSIPAGTKTVTVVLSEDTTVLEETVVVGYGTQKKVNLTGAVTAVEAKDRVSHNLSTMLQGSVAGFNISTSSGNPGSTGTLNIRGTTSINKAGPLVLIDGVPGDIDRVNPADVASISVIKDASAAAVYGARGAYGVVLVTRGMTARPQSVTADAGAGKSLPPLPTTRPAVTGLPLLWISSGWRTAATSTPPTLTRI